MQELHHHQFDNGLTLVAERMDWLESAAFAFAVPTGCVHDPVDRAGLANLTGEMVQRGCGNYSNRQFIEALDRLGAERSCHTGAVHTMTSASCLADHLIPVLAIHADMLCRPHLAPDQFDDARAVCLQELQAVEDDPAQKTMRRLRKESYSDPWGRSSQGDFASLEQMDIADVRQFHQQYFSPTAAILGVAGKFDWSELRDRSASCLGLGGETALPTRRSGPWHRSTCTYPTIPVKRRFRCRLPRSRSATIITCWHVPRSEC